MTEYYIASLVIAKQYYKGQLYKKVHYSRGLADVGVLSCSWANITGRYYVNAVLLKNLPDSDKVMFTLADPSFRKVTVDRFSRLLHAELNDCTTWGVL